MVDLKFLSLFPRDHHRNFKTKNHSRIKELLVSLSNPKFVHCVLHSMTNFGLGTLELKVLDRGHATQEYIIQHGKISSRANR